MQLTRITLNSKEFHPVKIDHNGVATLRVNGGAVVDAQHLTIQPRISRTNAASKVTAKLSVPYWFTPKGDTTKRGREVIRVDLTVALPPNCSDESRAEIVKDLQALVSAPLFVDCVKNLESIY